MKQLWPFCCLGRAAIADGSVFRLSDYDIEVHPSKKIALPEVTAVRFPVGSKAVLNPDDLSFVVDRVGVYEFLMSYRGLVFPKRVVAFDKRTLALPQLGQRASSPKDRAQKILLGIAADPVWSRFDIEYSMETMGELLPRSPATNDRGERTINVHSYCE